MADDGSPAAEAAPEPSEIKLHLGDRKLERWVEDLKAAPAQLNALKDAVVDLAGLDPIGRLGSYDYCRVTDVFEAKAQK